MKESTFVAFVLPRKRCSPKEATASFLGAYLSTGALHDGYSVIFKLQCRRLAPNMDRPVQLSSFANSFLPIHMLPIMPPR